jgi:hypothetical protein
VRLSVGGPDVSVSDKALLDDDLQDGYTRGFSWLKHLEAVEKHLRISSKLLLCASNPVKGDRAKMGSQQNRGAPTLSGLGPQATLPGVKG